MHGRPPRACRWLVTAAGRIVPRTLRPEWRRRWDRDVWNWWAFLAEHGAFDRYARAELIRHCWSAFPDALGTRMDLGPRVARALRSPWFCLAAAAFPAVLIALLSGFSGVRAVSMPLPYASPERVAVLAYADPLRLEFVAPESLAAWRKALRVQDLQAFKLERATLDGRPVRAARAETGFFSLLGVRPALGRLFVPGDGAGEPAAVLSHAVWRRLYHGDPATVGRVVRLNGVPVRIAGVLPPGFWFFHRDIAVWTVLHVAPPRPGAPAYYGAVARLQPFATALEAQIEMSNLAWQLPPRRGVWLQVLPLAERLRSAGRWCGGLASLAFAAVCLLALLAYHRMPRVALFLVAKMALIVAGLALFAMELPAAVYGPGSAGRGLLVEPFFLIAICLAVWWNWRDQRRRCRTCLSRLTLPVSFGNYGSPLLDRVGTELVCERGHGSLYVPGMHWSSSPQEHWTKLDSSWSDLFSAK